MGHRPVSFRCVILATVALTAPPSIAFGQESAPRRDPDVEQRQDALLLEEKVTVTATRLEEDPGLVGSSVTVVTAEEIRASGATWLMDVLSRVPGVALARTGGPGAVTTAFLRGTNSNQTLVLINGVRANTPSTGAYDLRAVPASQVDRIEIIRGPQSALYGSEAVGGVINVITRRGAGPPALDLTVEGGSFGTAHVAAGLQGGSSGLQYVVGVDYFNADNISAADARNGNNERDRFRNTALDARLEHSGDNGLGVAGFVTYFDGVTRIDGFDFSAGPIDDLDALQDNRELYAGAILSFDRGVYGGQLTLSTTDQRLGTSTPGGFQTAFELDTTVNELDLQNDLRFNADNTTIVGVERRRETADSRGTSILGVSRFDERIDVTGVYAQHRLSVRDRLQLSAGLRYEHHSRFGGHATYRVTAAWNDPSGLRAHGSIGSGFRAPTFNELFFPGFGNPALAPEESVGWDLGVSGTWAQGRLRADLTWFRNDLEELIEFAFPAGFVNLGAATAQGVEASGSFVLSAALRADLSYTFTDAKPAGSDQQLLRRPRHQGAIGLRYAPHALTSLFTELRYKGVRNDFGTIDVVELPAYLIWNAAAQVRITDALQVVGRLDNITNEHYQEVWGYGTPGFSGYVGLRYAWRAAR